MAAQADKGNMYDTYQSGSLSIQLKIGPCEGNIYNVGDSVKADYLEVSDGVYFGYEGAVVILNNIIVAIQPDTTGFETLPRFTKWGDVMLPNEGIGDLNRYNPVVRAIDIVVKYIKR